MLETAGTLCQAPVPALYPTQGTDASHSSAPAASFPQQSPDLGRLSGLMITLDKLLDPMDSMTKQPGGCLQTSAAIISFWKPTSSLELSGARPSPYCLWLLDGDVACRLWPGCQWTQLFELLPPNPDDACVLSATPAGVFNQDSLKTAVKYLIMPKYAWNCVGSRHLWAPTLDQGWGPKGGYDPAQQWAPSLAKERGSYSGDVNPGLESFFQGASIVRATPSVCTEGETEAALQEMLSAKVTQQVSALLRLRPKTLRPGPGSLSPP